MRLLAIPTHVLLAVFLAFALALYGQTPHSVLPQTQPGLGRDEGVFLSTTADNGSRAIYFIAGGTRHSILDADLQAELRTNPLWPVRSAERDDVLAYPEAAPVGAARTGLVQTSVVDAPHSEIASADAEPETYVLQRGDNLTGVSRAFGTTVEAILDANGISNPNRVYAGLPLVIPVAAPASVAETPSEAPTAESIDTQLAVAPAEDVAITHVVKRGESAIAIARQFGIHVDDLLAANHLANRDRIYAGQTLTIPGT